MTKNSNINIIFLSPKWTNEYLQTTVFRDGKELNIVRDITFWGLTNKPSVFITPENQYLYNYKALIENNGLCPFGYKIPNYNDIKNALINLDNQNSNQLKIKNYPYISQFQDEFVISTPKDETFLGTTTEEKDIYEFTSAIITLKSKYLEKWPISKNSALGVKCVENFNESLKDSVLFYDIYLAPKFNELKKQIISIISDPNNLKQNQSFTSYGKLIFNSDGLNVSELSFQAKKEFIELENKINYKIKSWDVYPYYEDIKIKSTAPINIKIERFKDDKSKFLNLEKDELFGLDLNIYENYELYSSVSSCFERQFKFNYKTTNYNIEFNGVLENNSNSNFLNKVKGKGPIYSLCSVVPGLGLYTIKTNKIAGIKLWHISVPIGAIAIASKIYSNFYYSKFLSDLEGSNSRKYYTQANFSQKVFMSSLGVYSLMSLVDFSITFGIGCKNKALQYSVNQKIRKTL